MEQPAKIKHRVEPPKREATVQPRVYKQDDPSLYQATWGTQPGTQSEPHSLPAQPQPQLTQPMHGPLSQQALPIFGPFSEPVATMQANVYSGQDVRAEDWTPQLPHVEPWAQDTGAWHDPSFRGRRG